MIVEMTEDLLKEVFKEFEKFLSLEGALSNWHYNKDRGFEIYDPSSFISGAFFWAETLEGHNFWSDLDAKWVSVCRQAGLFDE